MAESPWKVLEFSRKIMATLDLWAYHNWHG